MSELLRVLPADDEAAIRAAKITPRHLAGLLKLIEDGTISGKIAKDVFQKMVVSGEEARAIVAREGLTQLADEPARATIARGSPPETTILWNTTTEEHTA